MPWDLWGNPFCIHTHTHKKTYMHTNARACTHTRTHYPKSMCWRWRRDFSPPFSTLYFLQWDTLSGLNCLLGITIVIGEDINPRVRQPATVSRQKMIIAGIILFVCISPNFKQWLRWMLTLLRCCDRNKWQKRHQDPQNPLNNQFGDVLELSDDHDDEKNT